MTVRNLAPTTQATYVQQVSLFAPTSANHPTRSGLRRFAHNQVYLAMEKELAPSSICTAVAALRFLYNVTLQKHWVQKPTCLRSRSLQGRRNAAETGRLSDGRAFSNRYCR
jgi:hypothetical protein